MQWTFNALSWIIQSFYGLIPFSQSILHTITIKTLLPYICSIIMFENFLRTNSLNSMWKEFLCNFFCTYSCIKNYRSKRTANLILKTHLCRSCPTNCLLIKHQTNCLQYFVLEKRKKQKARNVTKQFFKKYKKMKSEKWSWKRESDSNELWKTRW